MKSHQFQIAKAFSLLTAVTCLSSCAYNGELSRGFYSGIDTPTKKIPAKVAVDKSRIMSSFEVSLESKYSVKTAEGLYAAVRSAMTQLFERVDEHARPPFDEDTDFIATPQFQAEVLERDALAGQVRFGTEFRLSFNDSKNYTEVASYRKKGEVFYSNPASVYVLSFLIVTMPLAIQQAGNHGISLFEANLDGLIKDASYEILADKAKFTMAANTIKPTPVTAAEDEKRLKAIPSKYDDFLSAVVVIRSTLGVGTGFFVSEDGMLVTNNHVIAGDETVSVKQRNGQVILGKIIKTNKQKDLALIKVDGYGFAYLTLGTLREAKVGSDVIAIGTPERLEWSVTQGVVSAFRNFDGVDFIQTDAAINSGNSGGPLIALLSGKVIGVNSQGVRKSVAEGLNFAISAEEVTRLIRN